jgi:PDZ domain-containing protein
MRRRTWAGLLALVLVVGLSVVALSKPVPYATFSPGPTVNVLGKNGGKQIISVSGHQSYRDKGGLRLTTIIASGAGQKINLVELVTAWLDPDRAVYPYNAVHAPTDTEKSVRQQSAVEMVSSQDNAVAAALGVLDIPYQSAVKVADVTKGGPADGKLEAGDLILEVNGKKVSTLDQLTGQIRPLPVGSRVTVKVRRDGRELSEKMKTTTSPQDKKSSALLVSIAPSYEFPFDVGLNLGENIGGPSGGLMFATGIYDILTPGSLTDGKVIAGTGEIDAQGKVGEIGGIQQKLVGAQSDGAKLFLVPAGNCAEALGGHYDPDKMRLVKVSTLEEAIADVQAWVKDPDAKLTRCTK